MYRPTDVYILAKAAWFKNHNFKLEPIKTIHYTLLGQYDFLKRN